MSAAWLPPLLPLFEVSAQMTSAPPCLLTSTWKKSARLRSPPVVQPMPFVQMPPLWLGCWETGTGVLNVGLALVAFSDWEMYGNQSVVWLPGS